MKTIRVTFLLLVVSVSLMAQEKPVRLESLLDQALERNPKIKAMEGEVQAYSLKIPQERTLPNPMLGFNLRNMGLSRWMIGEDIMSGLGFTFSQAIPFPGKLSLRGQVAAKAYERKAESLNAVKLSVLKEIKLAYFELFYDYKAIDILTRQRSLLEKALSLTEAKYAVGKGVQSDILKAQVEISKIDEMIIPMKQMIPLLKARINTLLDFPPDQELGIPEDQNVPGLEKSLQELQKLASENSPMVREAGLMIQESSKMVEMSRKDFYPDFVVQGGYDFRGKLTPMYEIMVGVEIPLYFKTKQANRLKESQALLESSRSNFTSASNELSFMVTESYIKAKASENLVSLYRERIIPQASLAVESSLANYQVDKIDFLSLLADITNLFSYEAVYYKEASQIWSSIAELEEFTGTKLVNWGEKNEEVR
jgi:outer membrane protein TolC